MSAGTAYPLLEASAAAEELIELLAPACERIEAAGSIRRLRDQVHDIELVAVPRVTSHDVPDGLFDMKTVHINELEERLRGLLDVGRLLTHPLDPKFGERYAKLVDAHSGLQVDVFSVLPPAQWGVIFLIRTGSASYSEWFVKAVREKGYHVVDGALHVGGSIHSDRCEVVPTPEEADVFRITGLPATPPHLRGAR